MAIATVVVVRQYTGETMPSNNQFLARLLQASGFFGVTERRIRAFGEGFAKGSWWLILWALVLSVPIFLSLFVITSDPTTTVSDFIRAVIASVVQASGGLSSLSATGGSLDGLTFYLDVALRPTALTLLLAVLAYRQGRARQADENRDRSSEGTSLSYALGLGAGFASLAAVATYVASGVASIDAELDSAFYARIEPASLLTISLMTVVIAIPAWMGGNREASSRRSSNPWVWAHSAVRTFALTYSVLILITLILIALYLVISPVFTYSSPEIESTEGFKLEPQQIGQVLAAIVGALLVLPTFLFYILTFGLGAGVGVKSDIEGLNILDLFGNLVPTNYLYDFGFMSLETVIGWPVFAAALLLVSLVALISGAAATYKTQVAIDFRRHFLVGLSAVAATTGILYFLTTISVSWTNKGVPASEIDETGLLLQRGLLGIGANSTSLLLIVALVAVFASLGAAGARVFTTSAFPKVVRLLSLGRLVNSGSRSLGALIFGTAITVSLMAAAIAPVSVAAIERAWATIDTPSKKISAVAEQLEKAELKDLKTLFTTDETKKLAWLPDAVLKQALPTSEMPQSLKLKNQNRGDWQVGQLDVAGTVSWKLPKSEKKIKITLLADGQVKDHLKVVTHADYTVAKTSITLDVAAGKFLAPTGKSNLQINGQKILDGNYRALPGAYVVSTDAYRLVAATKKTVLTNKAENVYVPEELPNLTGEYEKVLNDEINKKAKDCTNFKEIDKAKCFSLEDIYNSRNEMSKKEPSKYFGFQTNGFKVTGFECNSEPSDRLLSASHVIRVADCEVKMNFTLDYYKSKAETRKVTRQENYNACPSFGEAVCLRTRTVNMGTKQVEVRGDKIESIEFTSSVPVFVEALGFLDEKGKFSIVDRFIAPNYAPVKKPVPAPVVEEFELLGYYTNLATLKSIQTNPTVGDAYAVTDKYTIFVWTGSMWEEIK